MSDNLIVGEKHCRFHDIVSVLKDDIIIFKQWKHLGRELCISEADIEKLRLDLLLDKLTLCDIIHRILEDWKLRTGSKATLVELLGCMDVLKWFHISELLSKRFGIPYVCKETIIANKPLPKKLGVEDPVDTFTGRVDELKQLHEKLTKSTSTSTEVTVITQPSTIVGLGGIGKTELARRYIYTYGDNFNNILWINAESELSIQQRFKSVAKDELMLPLKDADGGEKDIFTVVQQVYRKFEDSKTLVIFDNAEIINSFKKYLPTCQRGHGSPTVLLTSRDRDWHLVFEVEIISLDELKMSEAIDLVKNGLKLSNNDQIEDIECLLKLLQCFPLAIQQAISYIKQKTEFDASYRIAAYIDEFKKSKAELLNSKIPLGSNTYTQTTFTTWNLTMQSVKGDQECGNLATRIIEVIAYMAPDNISHNFFIPMRKIVKVKSNLVKTLRRMVCSLIWKGANTEPNVEDDVTEEKVKLAIRLLVKYSMVKRISDSSVSVHRLVQEVTIIRLREAGKEYHVLQEALELLSKADKTSLPKQGPTIWKFAEKWTQLVLTYSMIPLQITQALISGHKYGEAYIYYQDTITRLKEVLPDCHRDVLYFLSVNGRYLYNIGKSEEGLSILKDVIEKQNKILGTEHPDTLTTMHDMAFVLQSQGEFNEALSMYTQVLEKRKQILGSNHPDTLTTMNSMALVFISQGKLNEAISMYMQVLEKRKQILGLDNPDTLTTMNDMAIALKNQGNFDEALFMYTQVLEKRKQFQAPDHIDTLTAMHNIGCLLNSQGKNDEALSMFKEVLEKRKQILGSDHPDTLTTMHNMAGLLNSQAKYDEAISMYMEALEKRKRILGSDHPKTLMTMSDMALVFISQAKFDEAISIYMEVLEKWKHSLGLDHPSTLRAMNNKASVLNFQGKYDEALSLYIEVLRKRKQIQGSNHPDTLRSMSDMGLVYISQAKFDEALSIYMGVLEKWKNILGSDHPNTLTAMNNKAFVLNYQGKYDEALSIHMEVLRKRKHIQGSNHPDTLRSMHNAAIVLKSQGKLDEALSMYIEVLEKRKRILGSDHPDTLKTMDNMAVVLNNQGNCDKALSMHTEVLEKRRLILGSDHPDTLTTMHNIAVVLNLQGKVDKALSIFMEVLEKRKQILGADHPDTLTTTHIVAAVDESRDVSKSPQASLNQFELSPSRLRKACKPGLEPENSSEV